MIIRSTNNIDIIQGIIGYGNAEGITDWRISNTNTGILNISNSTSADVRVSILENGNVGIGTNNPGSTLDIVGDPNITGVYTKNNRDVINDTSNYVLSSSNLVVQRILREVGNGSNYVDRLNTALNTRVDDTSNYVLDTSNIIDNRIITRWVNTASGIYYNALNIGIGTTNPTSKLHLYDDTIRDTKLTIQNNKILPTIISVTGTTENEISGTTYRYISFPYSGSGTTKTYSFTPTENLLCDILIIGGGGGGSTGGGGGGGYLYLTNISLNSGTSYTATVGNGGTGTLSNQNGNQGANSSFIGGSLSYTAFGGGGGGAIFYTAPPHTTGQVGSYGGNGADYSTQQTYTSTQGNRGGSASINRLGSGGGGGGADQVGGDPIIVPGVFAGPTTADEDRYWNGGIGGNGKLNDITGTAIYYAGGGTGGANTNNQTNTATQTPPLGGGGLGSRAHQGSGGNGTDGLGGGGGGGDPEQTVASGRGGSGIVIIRYTLLAPSIELIRGTTGDANIDYKIGNYLGDFKIISSTSSVDTDYIRITSSGASIYNPTGSPQWSTVSDRRIKENIEKASYDKCYDNINKLELYRFNYIKELNNINKDLKQLGYIAQEVQDIFPKAVSSQEFYNNNLSIPGMLSIDIAQINYSLYGTVKKLMEMYNDKKSRLKKLEYLIENTSNITIQDTSMLI
jgi:hypothetical protein